MDKTLDIEKLKAEFEEFKINNKFQNIIDSFEKVADYLAEEDYFELLYDYLDALLYLDKIEILLSVIDQEFIVPGISEEDFMKLNDYYDQALMKKQNKSNSLTIEEIKNLLVNETDIEKLSNLIISLENINIRNILDEAIIFLNREVDACLKTMLLEKMIIQQISDNIVFKKGNKEFEFIPLANQLVSDNHNFIKTRLLLNDHLAQYPSYLIMCEDVLSVYAYMIYPEVIDEKDVNKLAALIEYYVFKLNEVELINDFEGFYNIDTNGIIKELEQLVNIINGEIK